MKMMVKKKKKRCCYDEIVYDVDGALIIIIKKW